MSIGLFAIFVYGGINYINIDQFKTKEKEALIETSFVVLETNFSIFRNQKDYYLPTTNWENELLNIGKTIPDIEDGYSWEYGKNISNNYYFCITSTQTSKIHYEAMNNIANNRNKAYINTACGADENTTVMTPPTSFPNTVSLTYWIKK